MEHMNLSQSSSRVSDSRLQKGYFLICYIFTVTARPKCQFLGTQYTLNHFVICVYSVVLTFSIEREPLVNISGIGYCHLFKFRKMCYTNSIM